MKKIKPVPFRHRPKGLTIIYEDQDIIVVNKSCGLLTVEANYEKVIFDYADSIFYVDARKRYRTLRGDAIN